VKLLRIAGGTIFVRKDEVIMSDQDGPSLGWIPVVWVAVGLLGIAASSCEEGKRRRSTFGSYIETGVERQSLNTLNSQKGFKNVVGQSAQRFGARLSASAPGQPGQIKSRVAGNIKLIL
jgi:hypothetical protein